MLTVRAGGGQSLATRLPGHGPNSILESPHWTLHQNSMPTVPCGLLRLGVLAVIVGLLANGCGAGEDLAGPVEGSLQVVNRQSGAGADPDGIIVVLDQTDPRTLSVDSTLLYSDLSIGQHRLTIEGLASNCTLDGVNPRVVTVVPDSTVRIALEIACTAPMETGTLVFRVSTRGLDLDPDGYAAVVDALEPQPVEIGGEVTFPALSADSHAVRLSGIANNCTLAGENPRIAVVTAHDTVTTTWDVSCWPPPAGRIAFVIISSDVESWNLFVINADGTGFTPLTSAQGEVNEEPNWSPDGAEIAYTSFLLNEFSPREIRILRPANGVTRTLPTGSLSPSTIRWSPDGSQLSFMDFNVDESLDHVYLINANGSGAPRRLAQVGSESDAAWSPIGDRLAFVGRDSLFGPGRLYTVDRGGTNLRQITPTSLALGFENGETEWSPDGTRIVFVGPHPFGEEFGKDIYVVGADGSGLLNLTRSPPFSSNKRPRWSPDGKSIAFLCSEVDPQGSIGDICTVAADGSAHSNLTNVLATYDDLRWSPDGTKIVFIGPERSEPLFGTPDLYIMNADGSGTVRLTHSPETKESPAWTR